MAGVASSFPSLAAGEPRLVQGDYKFDLNTKERVAWDIPPKIHALEPIAPGAPILALMNRLQAPVSKKTPIFYMFQRANLRNFITAAANYNPTGNITIAAADVKLFKVGTHLINVRTREILRVNSTPATTLPVTRSVGTVAAAAGLSGDEMVILGYRGAESDTRFEGVLRQPTMQFNYIGELQDSYTVSQYADAAAMVDGVKTRKDARMDKLEQMRYTLEKASIFDQRAKFLNESGKMVYIPNGLDAICTENEYDFNGSMSESKLLAAMESVARYGPSTRWVMAAPRFMRKINELFSGEREQDTEVVTFAGVNVTKYKGGGLTLNIFPHLMFQDAPTTGALSMSGTAYVCNFERGGPAPGFGQATMTSEKMGFFKWFLNLEYDGNREVVDQLVVNYGFSYTFAEHFARWINPGS